MARIQEKSFEKLILRSPYLFGPREGVVAKPQSKVFVFPKLLNFFSDFDVSFIPEFANLSHVQKLALLRIAPEV
jgi:hypothetical protein